MILKGLILLDLDGITEIPLKALKNTSSISPSITFNIKIALHTTVCKACIGNTIGNLFL